jgi:hypothetical protein
VPNSVISISVINHFTESSPHTVRWMQWFIKVRKLITGTQERRTVWPPQSPSCPFPLAYCVGSDSCQHHTLSLPEGWLLAIEYRTVQ